MDSEQNQSASKNEKNSPSPNHTAFQPPLSENSQPPLSPSQREKLQALQEQQALSQGQDDLRKENQVYTYTAPWSIYSMGFSTRPDMKYRMAIGSFLEDIDNKVEIIQLNDSLENFEVKTSFTHKYPPTKLMWIPDMEGNYPDIMATSGETLKIWQVKENGVQLKSDLVNNKQIEFSAPLTSFDWYPSNMSLIGTSSIDTTCTIWNIDKEVVYTQLIAHDKEVYDISFSPEDNIFASVGADGSAR